MVSSGAPPVTAVRAKTQYSWNEKLTGLSRREEYLLAIIEPRSRHRSMRVGVKQSEIIFVHTESYYRAASPTANIKLEGPVAVAR